MFLLRVSAVVVGFTGKKISVVVETIMIVIAIVLVLSLIFILTSE